jgi:hypothetical protein
MSVNEKVLNRTIERFRERRILLPTFAHMRDPQLAPEKIRRRLKNVGHMEESAGRARRIV